MSALLQLFLVFFKIGLFTFGGGHAMIPMITEEVAQYGISGPELTQLIAVSESTPGPFAINIATFVGSTTYGFPGALLATLGVIMPSFLIILLVAVVFQNFSQNKTVKKIISGINPVVIGLIAAAGIGILLNNVFPSGLIGSSLQLVPHLAFDWVQLILFAALYLLYKLLGRRAHPIALIIIAGFLGVAIYYFYQAPIFN